MTEAEVIRELRDAGALLEGHFILSSGLRSPKYMQCARAMMDADRGGRLAGALASKVRAALDGGVDLVVAPAMGGVVIGYEMGRQLSVPAIFFERVDGRFVLRRGFEIAPGTRTLIVEDVVTTGLSSRECIEAAVTEGADVVAEACLVDRSGGGVDVGVPLVALVSLDIPSYTEDQLPTDLRSVPAIKPGSRGLG